MKKEYQYPNVKVVDVDSKDPILITSGGDDDPIFG